MPRKYRKTNRRRMGKKSNKTSLTKWASTGAKVATTAYKAYQLASKIARVVNVEYKYNDYQIANAIDNNVQTTSGLLFFENISQGDLNTQREGDSIKPMRLSGRIFVTQNSSAQKTLIRFILVRFGYSPMGNPPQDYEILESTSNPLSPKAHGYKFGSKILWDRTYHMSNNGNSSIIQNIDFKLYGHCNYIQNTSSVQKGGLYLFMISNESTNTPTVNGYFRLTFTDN